MKQRWMGLIVCVVLVFGLVPAAGAQTKAAYHFIQLLYWSASGPVTGVTTGFWDLEYGMIRADSPWGYHLHYLTGSQSAGGTSTFWNAEASYALGGLRLAPGVEGANLRATLGYGSYGWTVAGPPGAVTSTGFRVGLHAAKALQAAPGGGGLSLHVGYNWFPSNSSQSSTGTSSGAVTDWSVALVYKFPTRLAAAPAMSEIAYAPASLIRQPLFDRYADDWSAELGLRGVTADAGTAASVYNWSGIFFGVAKTF